MSSACEPAEDLQVSARIVEIEERGAKARVVIEVLLASRLDLSSFRVHQARLSLTRRNGARLGVARRTAEEFTPVALPESRAGRLDEPRESALWPVKPASRRLLRGDPVAAEDATLIRAGTPQAIRYTVTLSRGMDHHVLLDVAAEDASGETHATQAYVRVGLDPRNKAERPEGLVQFRARQLR